MKDINDYISRYDFKLPDYSGATSASIYKVEASGFSFKIHDCKYKTAVAPDKASNSEVSDVFDESTVNNKWLLGFSLSSGTGHYINASGKVFYKLLPCIEDNAGKYREGLFFDTEHQAYLALKIITEYCGIKKNPESGALKSIDSNIEK